MDKLKKYKRILQSELEQQTAVLPANTPDITQQLVINKEETSFLLLKYGWVNDIFKHTILYHFEIKNDKIWLFKNNTDIEIGKRLTKQGIPKSDIVIGFVSEIERGVEGYARA